MQVSPAASCALSTYGATAWKVVQELELSCHAAGTLSGLYIMLGHLEATSGCPLAVSMMQGYVL